MCFVYDFQIPNLKILEVYLCLGEAQARNRRKWALYKPTGHWDSAKAFVKDGGHTLFVLAALHLASG